MMECKKCHAGESRLRLIAASHPTKWSAGARKVQTICLDCGAGQTQYREDGIALNASLLNMAKNTRKPWAVRNLMQCPLMLAVNQPEYLKRMMG